MICIDSVCIVFHLLLSLKRQLLLLLNDDESLINGKERAKLMQNNQLLRVQTKGIAAMQMGCVALHTAGVVHLCT